MKRSLAVTRERWPLRATFTISRGSKTASEVVVARVRESELEGRGECLPYPRYGETPAAVAAAIEALAPAVGDGMGRVELQEALPAGAARNALDCALWDLECKATGRRAWEIAGLPAPRPLATACTRSLDTPDAMRARVFTSPIASLDRVDDPPAQVDVALDTVGPDDKTDAERAYRKANRPVARPHASRP